MKTASWYHTSLKSIGRSAGRSAVACAAYRTGTTMTDERYAAVRDFSAKSDVVTHFTIAPKDAPAWAHDAEPLWNAVEARETRKNSQVAFEWEIALPNEPDADSREAIARRFSQWLVDEYGVAMTTGIHEGGQRGNGLNDHCHVMMTTRSLGAEGWAKNKLRDFNVPPGHSNPEVEHVRKQIADCINGALEESGSDTRVDHRSFAARGISREPTLHLGPAATALERAGVDGGERARINREIIEERYRWQLEQAVPQISPEVERELSRRWDNWQPLQSSADAFASSDAPALAPGTPATTDEGHTGWRRFVDRVRAFQAKALELWHDETSGGVPEGRLAFLTRILSAGTKLVIGVREGEGPEFAEGLAETAELAGDLATKQGNTDGSADSGIAQRKSFTERVRESTATFLHNERGCVPDDDFDRAVRQWAQAPPHDEGPPALSVPEPDQPEPDGPDID